MQKKPEIIVFAGPNGSGKSTVTRLANIIEPYINADDIKKSSQCTNLEAAQTAFKKRKTEYFIWENDFWTNKRISELTGIKE